MSLSVDTKPLFVCTLMPDRRWYELDELLDLLAAFDAGKDDDFLPNFHVVSLDVITD